MSDDGRYVASAAERIVRVAAVADGRVIGRAAGGGRRDGVGVRAGLLRAIAVGDATGAVVIAPLATGARARDACGSVPP